MSRKLEFLLRAWGDDHIAKMEYADEYGTNILYEAGVLQGRVQDSSHSQSKILCPESAPSVRRVRMAVETLPLAQKMAVVGWYCAPLKEDNTPYTMGQIANKARMTLPAFDKQLKSAKRALKAKLLYK